MPGQKKKYNVRFPPGRIKKIMQKDTEVGRIATAVPVIISRALEMFLRSLLTKSSLITQSKHSRIMSSSHVKQCIESEKLFDFLRDLAEHAASTARQGRTKGKWAGTSGHRKRWQDVPAKTRPPEADERPKRPASQPADDGHSSSEPELFICLDA
ncbi:dr1-associated corepressor-like isoform X2 [Denticeps clupeoides]|uniref:Dr1-associated corepressor n=1 Tax=Denticeps clupeoides TaxID=299321 RepID=A0AAY4BJB8_9TELE|nr:dr1-associated corepressor-like isoform X2 [Denticeps clupeoides]XP_028843482.1 dr1-associated corepressor-like isoform X2 [Denticeps clupeoides]